MNNMRAFIDRLCRKEKVVKSIEQPQIKKISDLTLREIIQTTRNRTTLQARNDNSYVGQWCTIEGWVFDIVPIHIAKSCLLTLTPSDGDYSVSCFFDEGLKARLLMLEIGEKVVIEGEIENVAPNIVSLGNCSFIPVDEG